MSFIRMAIGRSFSSFSPAPLQSGNGIVIIFLDKISAIPDRQRTGHILRIQSLVDSYRTWQSQKHPMVGIEFFQFMSRLSRRLHKKEFS